mgnify:FL=1
MCPPGEAGTIEGNFYRLCNSNVPNKEDFRTHYEKNNIPVGQECEARALSFCETLKSANSLRRKFKRFKNKVPVLVEITSSHGIGIIENHHLNLWEFSGVSFVVAKSNSNGGE